MAKKNILIIIPSLRFAGWPEKNASIIGSQLFDSWYNVHFFTFYDVHEKYQIKWERHCFYQTPSKNFLKNVFFLVQRALKIRSIIEEESIDTVISYTEQANFSTILARLMYKINFKLIVSIRYSLKDYKRQYYHLLVKYLYKYADIINVLTDEEKFYLSTKFTIPKTRIVKIHNPISIKEVNIQKKLGFKNHDSICSENKYTFMSWWVLNHTKNHERLIRDFDTFHHYYPNTELIIIWDWPLRIKLLRLIETLPSKNTITIIWIQKNIYKYLSKADCFISTSFAESFWNLIIEAMACSVPIIASRTQWAKEILWNGRYGLLININDDKSLLHALELIYINKKLQKKYSELSLMRSKEFDGKKIIREWIKLINN